MFKKYTVFFLLCTLMISSVTFADTLSDAQNRKSEAEKKMNVAKDAKEQEQERINYMKAELDIIEQDLNNINMDLKKANYELGKTEKELNQQEKEMKQYNIDYGKRLKVIYEEGSIGYLDVILSSKSFSDFLERVEIIKSLAEYDNNILKQMEAKKNEIATTKAKIEEEKTRVEEQKRDRQVKVNQKNAIKQEHEALRNNYANAESAAKKQYEEAEKAEKAALAEIQRKMAEAAKSKGGSKIQTGYSRGMLRSPVNGHPAITSDFSMRIHPWTGEYKQHTGIDFGVSAGSPVFAAGDGTVITSAYNGAYGNYVVINHGGGLATLYAHHQRNIVSVGQKVKAGDQIGVVGSTGYSTGPHCHFEVIVNGKQVDPKPYIGR